MRLWPGLAAAMLQWQRTLQLGPELRLAPLQDDGLAQETAEAGAGQSLVLRAEQHEDKILVVNTVDQRCLVEFTGPLGPHQVVGEDDDGLA